MSTSKQLTILFAPFDAYGHVYACIGIAQTLSKRGHHIVFATNQSWSGKLSAYGFSEEIYYDSTKEGHEPSQYWTEFMSNFGHTLSMSPFEKIKYFEAPGWADICGEIKRSHPLLKEIVARVKPNVIVVDSFITIPALMNAGIPWVNLVSCNQLFYYYEGIKNVLPPGGSGYATDSDKSEWKKFYAEAEKEYANDFREYSLWLSTVGADQLKDPTRFCNESPFLNLYLCPNELDYTELRPTPPKWYNIDYLMRDEDLGTDTTAFTIPESLQKIPGKLIYVSMGSMASSEINLMKRLVTILSQSPHRFIMSKGPMGDHYQLGSNMWGDRMIPQTKILSLVDLVITHGGNNTVTESLYFGKPMIVMPIFSDQYDNAQRLSETKLGIRLDPYRCEPKVLLNAIEKMLDDKQLLDKLKIISQRMRNAKSKERAAALIENLVN